MMRVFNWLAKLLGIGGFADPSLSHDDSAVDDLDVGAPKALWELRQKHNGDLGLALFEKGLVDVADVNAIDTISDARLNGNLRDMEFAWLKELPNLRRIWLRGILITDDGLSAIEKMPKLEELLLEDRKYCDDMLSDNCLIHISKQPRLKQLLLENSSISGEGFAHFCECDTLIKLDVTNSLVDDNGLKMIARFRNLQELQIASTKVTDEGLKLLGSLSNLRRLSIRETSVTNQGLSYLVNSQLQELDLCDTSINDNGCPFLLTMQHLEVVKFGCDQVSVATIEQLRTKGIEVSHGTVLNLHRESNVLRYKGRDYEVDQNKSALHAYMSLDRDEIVWKFEIQCTDAYVPDYVSPPCLDGPPMYFKHGDWRNIKGEEFRVNYSDKGMFPLLPDNPCNIYDGQHALPDNHVIRFLERKRNKFLIEWSCLAKDFDEDPGSEVYVFAEIPFSEVEITSYDAEFRPEHAFALVRKHFHESDLERPVVNSRPGCVRVQFPIIAKD